MQLDCTAHKLARLIYAMLKNGTEYVELGEDEYERRYRKRVMRNLHRKARAFGYRLVEIEGPVPNSMPI